MKTGLAQKGRQEPLTPMRRIRPLNDTRYEDEKRPRRPRWGTRFNKEASIIPIVGFGMDITGACDVRETSHREYYLKE